MNDDKLNLPSDTDTKKAGSVAKIITILGLVGILLFLTWSSVQVVKLFPSAVSSLASLADTVYTYKENMGKKDSDNLVLNADNSMINSGENLVVWWENKNDSGSYSFRFTCIEGLSLDIKTLDKDFTDINCENNYDLGLVDRVVLKIDSDTKDFSVMDYSIAYYKDNKEEAVSSTTKQVSIINQKLVNNSKEDTNNISTTTSATSTEISSTSTQAVDTKDTPDSLATTTTSENSKDPIKVTTKNPDSTKTSENTTKSYKQIYTYSIPVSKPDGYTDLLLNNLDVGYINQSNKFIKNNLIDNNKSNAIQFIVHNIGNKTSNDWIFEIKTSDKMNYVSEKQLPLKPNERATITISLPSIENTNSQKISVLIKTNSDKNKNNNYLEKTVIVVE